MTTTKLNGAAKTAKTIAATDTDKAIKRLNATCDQFTARCSQLYLQGADLATEIKRAGISLDGIPHKVEIMLAEQKANRATVKCEVEIPAWVYGHLCAAAAVHGHADYKATLLEYLDRNVTEWGNCGYILED